MGEANPQAIVPATLRKTLLLTLVLGLAALALGQGSWARGLAVGGLASAANFFLMAWLLPRAVGASRRRAEGWSLASLALRLGLMAAALGLALHWPGQMAPGACAAGLFMVQITLLLERLFHGRLAGGSARSG